MNAHVVAHIRESPAGPVVVTPVPFVERAVEAPTAVAGLAELRPALTESLEALEPVDRVPFAVPPQATLMRLPVEVELGGKGGDSIQLHVGVVVLERLVGDQPVLLAYVPVLAHFDIVVRGHELDRLTHRLTRRVAKRLRSWPAATVLNADEPEDSRLETIELEVRSGARAPIELGLAPGERTQGVLEELGVELTQRELGRIDGREELVQRVLEALAGPGRSSVLLVGPNGVGKTALVHELARRIASGTAPPALEGRRVWRVSANELIAGATYTGQWQERVRRLIEEARRTQAIVAMGDPVGIIDAGRWSRSDNNFSRFLRPFVEDGDVTLVCECTAEQLGAARKQEPNFIDAFHRIDVAEPTNDEARAITTAAAGRLSGASLPIEPEAIEAAIELTARFEPYRSFPGKAVRLLEDAVREREDGVEALDRAALTATFARRSGLPLALLSDTVPLRLPEVEAYFESRVLGQPEAVATVVDLVAVLKAGLNDPQKPLGSFFFVGPTGVGKTELAKALATFLFGSQDRLVRFDMGEYASADAVQRLIGTAWGSDEGELTRRVREQPFSVVLLDEIEKAHWSVFDALLAVIGEGRLSDAAGRVADFRNAIVIMTSNLGARRAGSSPLGFGADRAGDGVRGYVEEAEKFFRPEFFNRIDRVVVFHQLSAQTVRKIARRELDRLLVREGIVRRRLLLEVDDTVLDLVAETGFHPRYGARPLQRALERLVIQPLARLLLDRTPEEGDFIRVQRVSDRITVEIERATEERHVDLRRERRAAIDDAAFGKTERAAAGFVERIDDDEAATFADELRVTASGLIQATHEASFWDETGRAAATLQRIYTLEQLLDRFDALRERAAGLVELARRVRETENRARLAEIDSAVSEMDDQLVVLRLELAAAAAGGDGDAAVVRVLPIGKAAGWAEQLLGMYAAWADRTGREASRAPGEGFGVTSLGPATADLLDGEAGLHRHVQPEGREELARVVIETPGEGARAVEDPGAVVRVYEDGKRRVVRDPRTGVRESHITKVLREGWIDAFLIAMLRERASSGAAREA